MGFEKDEEVEAMWEIFHDLQDHGYYCHNREFGCFNPDECCGDCLSCVYFHQ